nr:unnamed protein product [Callosobruchus chinensis]
MLSGVAENVNNGLQNLSLWENVDSVDVSKKSFFQIFVESAVLDKNNRIRSSKFFLGMCHQATLERWKFCSPQLEKKRPHKCKFHLKNGKYHGRVHRRYCDFGIMNRNPDCQCVTTIFGETMFKVIGQVGMISVGLRITNEPGQYECYWHFHHEDRRFGRWLGCQVIVDPFDLKGNKSVLETSSAPAFNTRSPKFEEDYNLDRVINQSFSRPTLQQYTFDMNSEYSNLRNEPEADVTDIVSDKHTYDKLVRDISVRVGDIKLQDPTDTNCSSDSDNQSAISLSDSKDSKELKDDLSLIHRLRKLRKKGTVDLSLPAHLGPQRRPFLMSITKLKNFHFQDSRRVTFLLFLILYANIIHVDWKDVSQQLLTMLYFLWSVTPSARVEIRCPDSVGNCTCDVYQENGTAQAELVIYSERRNHSTETQDITEDLADDDEDIDEESDDDDIVMEENTQFEDCTTVPSQQLERDEIATSYSDLNENSSAVFDELKTAENNNTATTKHSKGGASYMRPFECMCCICIFVVYSTIK